MLTNATLINKNAKPKSPYSSNARYLKVWASFTNVTTSEYFRQIHLFFFLLVSFTFKIKSLNILSQWWNHRSWSKNEHVIRESYSAYTVREKRVKIYSTTVKLWSPFERYSAHLKFPPLNWINHTKLANCEEHLEKNLSTCHHYPILWSSFLTCCSTSCIWLISLDITGAESMWSISMATAESPPCPKPLATLDLCNTEPDNEDGGRLSTAAPWENCSLLSFCCFRFYMNKRKQ